MSGLHNCPGRKETLDGAYKNILRLYFHCNISCSDRQNCGKIVYNTNIKIIIDSGRDVNRKERGESTGLRIENFNAEICAARKVSELWKGAWL